MGTVERYIELTRATGVAVYFSNSGVTEIPAGDIPALLNSETNGQFRMEFASFLAARVHIQFEKLDNEGKFDDMRVMLESDPKLAKFLRWHMKKTGALWKWNFPSA